MNRSWILSVMAAAAAAAFAATPETPPVPPATPATPDAPAAKKNYDKPGFATALDKHGRLWVFRADSKEWAEFREKGEPAKQVVRPRSGPDGLTLKAPDAETLDAYLAAE